MLFSSGEIRIGNIVGVTVAWVNFELTTNIITTVQYTAQLSLTVNKVKLVGSWGVTLDLSGPGDFVELLPVDKDACFVNIGKCSTGVTVVMKIKITKLVENMVYFSSGGEKEDGYGWVVMYKYGRLQVRK